MIGGFVVESDRCPACREPKVVGGTIASVEMGGPDRFFPGRTRHGLSERPGVAMAPGGFHACISCGLVWSSVNPASLRDCIRDRGDALAREQLDDFEVGLLRGLPETDLAREVAAKVAAVNASACAGKPGEAARRFRDLAGVSWDRAHEVIRKWPELPREEKLALFGWAAKRKVADDEFF